MWKSQCACSSQQAWQRLTVLIAVQLASYIYVANAALYNQPFFLLNMTSLTTASYDEYDGIYLLNNTIPLTYCSPASSGYSGTLFYQQEGGTKYVYEDWVSTIYARLIIADGAIPQCVDTTPAANAYDFAGPATQLTFGNSVWPTMGRTPPYVVFTNPAGDVSVRVKICDAVIGGCNTPDPTKSPTLEPTLEPTFQPTSMPTVEPTVNPTPPPTAYQVKYHWSATIEGATIGCTSSLCRVTFDVGLFVWMDPLAPSYSVLSILGPADQSYLVWLTQLFPNSTDDGQHFLYLYRNSTGFVVNPTDQTAGNIVLDLQLLGTNAVSDYGDMNLIDQRWDQVSNITAFEANYQNSGRTFVQFRTPIPTATDQDWEYNFYQLLDPVQLCYAISPDAYRGTVATQFNPPDPFGCHQIRKSVVPGVIEGNYAVAGKIEMAPTADIEIYFEHDPFTFAYRGYMIKPRNAWVVWGNYFRTEPGVANCSQFGVPPGCLTQFWRYSGFCDTESAGTTYLCGLGQINSGGYAKSSAPRYDFDGQCSRH